MGRVSSHTQVMHTSAPRPAPNASLRPREHGAYAMLAFPVASGLLVGGVSLAGLSFAVLAGAGFLAHEAALVVLGRRGARVRDAAAGAAWRRLRLLALVALAAGGAFALTAPGAAWRWAILSGALGAAVVGLLLLGRTRSLTAELLVATAFATLHGVLAASAGADAAAAALGVAVWVAAFALATLSVHALKARFKRTGRGPAAGGAAGTVPGGWLVWAAPAAAGCALLAAVSAPWAGWSVGGVPLAPPSAALAPKAVLVLAVAGLKVHPRHLKRVGWSMVVADVGTLAAVAAAVASL